MMGLQAYSAPSLNRTLTPVTYQRYVKFQLSVTQQLQDQEISLRRKVGRLKLIKTSM